MENTLDEGVIKFQFKLTPMGDIPDKEYKDLEKWRAILFKMNLIGEYPIEKVGFGNISKRTMNNEFLITGTQTGKYPNLNGSHYTYVKKCELKKMHIEAKGPIAPSSESLTHFSFYSRLSEVNFIFHIHSHSLWNHMIDKKYLSTSENTPYGTFEMAQEVERITKNLTSGLICMKGHQDGIIAFGKSADEVGQLILTLQREFKKS